MSPFTAPSPIKTGFKSDKQIRHMSRNLLQQKDVIARTPDFVVELLRSGTPGQRRFAIHVVFRVELSLAAVHAQEVPEFQQLSEEDKQTVRCARIDLFEAGPDAWSNNISPLLDVLQKLQSLSWSSLFHSRVHS